MTSSEFTTEELANEIWKSVVGYEFDYSVSSLGRLRRNSTGLIFRLSANRSGYTVALLRNGKARTTVTLHGIVAAAFIGPRPAGYGVNHKDGTKTNNRAGNLEYATPQENMNHAKAHNLVATGDRNASRLYPERRPRGEKHNSKTRPETILRGERHGMSKLTAVQVVEIRRRKASGDSLRTLSKAFGVGKSAIADIVNFRHWKYV